VQPALDLYCQTIQEAELVSLARLFGALKYEGDQMSVLTILCDGAVAVSDLSRPYNRPLSQIRQMRSLTKASKRCTRFWTAKEWIGSRTSSR